MEQSAETPENSLKNKTAKGLLWGGASNALFQLIGLFFGIYLSRLLTPADYGMVGMITIFSVIASAFQESGFVNGIANKKEVQHKDYNAVFWTSVSIGSILYCLLFLAAPLIANYYQTPELKNLSRVAFLSFWFGSFGIAHNAYLFRNLLVKERAISQITSLILSNIIGLILAYQGFNYWSIAIQTIVYSLMMSVMYTYFSKYRPTFNFNISPIKEMMGFSSKILITNMFIHLNNNILPVILGKYYNAHDVGNVTQASKWGNTGQSLIREMVNSITQPILNQIRDDQERRIRVFRKLLAFTSFIAFPALFGLSLVADEFILITITEKYIESAHFLRIICIGGAFLCVSNVFSHFILSKGKSNIFMWSTISFGLLQILIYLLCRNYGIQQMLITACLLQCAWLLVWFYLIQPFMRYTFAQLCKDVFSYALMAIVATIGAYFLTAPILNIYLKFIIAIFATIIIYTALNRILLPAILLELIDYLKKIIRKK